MPRAVLVLTSRSRNRCAGERSCRASDLSDIREQGYLDARQMPFGRMTAQQIEAWTDAIEEEK